MQINKNKYLVYKKENKRMVSFPLGGIGAGSIGLSASGRLISWEIFNKPNKWGKNGFSHFSIKAEDKKEVLESRVLHGGYEELNVLGVHTRVEGQGYGQGVDRFALAGFPDFEEAYMENQFPFAKIHYVDEKFPAKVTMLAFSPFIPLDQDNSSIPVAMFEFEIKNITNKKLNYTIAGVLNNPGESCSGNHKFYNSKEKIITLYQSELNNKGPTNNIMPNGKGNISIGSNDQYINVQKHWYRGGWFDNLNIYWKDFNKFGNIPKRDYDKPTKIWGDMGTGSHSVMTSRVELQPEESKVIKMCISWFYPKSNIYWNSNMQYWNPNNYSNQKEYKNWYAKKWSSSKEISKYVLKNWKFLKNESQKFRDIIWDSNLPKLIKDASMSNLSILKTPTILRLDDGNIWGWEGANSTVGSCPGTCTHVYNYQQSIPFLFPKLERGIRELDYKYNFMPNGGMTSRFMLPYGYEHIQKFPVVDSHMGNVIKTFRDWKLSGDDKWLNKVYEATKKALSFSWSKNNPHKWDINKTGIIHGRQHNTLDVEIFEANSWLSSMYLTALKAMSFMAKKVKDYTFEKECLNIFDKGKKWFEENLFNGEYFFHKIDIKNKEIIDKFDNTNEIKNDNEINVVDFYWSKENNEIKYQVGNGCLTDQIIGQWYANLYGIGEIINKSLSSKAYDAILKNNFKNMRNVFNPYRSYAIGNEEGIIICSYPQVKKRPAVPITYESEVFTGIEYAFAQQLIYSDKTKAALKVVEAIRNRYSGKLRNPFSEIECGNDYVRSMSSFGLIIAFTKQESDMSKNSLAFNAKLEKGKYPFFSGTSCGLIILQKEKIELKVVFGEISLKSLKFKISNFKKITKNNDNIDFAIKDKKIHFSNAIKLKAKQSLILNF